MLSYSITIFTDGSSRGNPGPGGWGAVVIAGASVTESGGRAARTTNNRMELTAAIEALKGTPPAAGGAPPLQIFSDSGYLVNGITKWVRGWRVNGWKTAAKKEVENRDLWEKLVELTTIHRSIEWKLVGGHAGVAGNERCDEIATAFAGGGHPKLYSGPFFGYPIKKILDVSAAGGRRAGRAAARAYTRAAAYSYVSSVDGVVQTHKTWDECEARVKGKRGARYKKVLSADEEAATTNLWRSH